jgi:hypothetical protein
MEGGGARRRGWGGNTKDGSCGFFERRKKKTGAGGRRPAGGRALVRWRRAGVEAAVSVIDAKDERTQERRRSEIERASRAGGRRSLAVKSSTTFFPLFILFRSRYFHPSN